MQIKESYKLFLFNVKSSGFLSFIKETSTGIHVSASSPKSSLLSLLLSSSSSSTLL